MLQKWCVPVVMMNKNVDKIVELFFVNREQIFQNVSDKFEQKRWLLKNKEKVENL